MAEAAMNVFTDGDDDHDNDDAPPLGASAGPACANHKDEATRICEFAQQMCDVMDKGDTSELYSMLNISVKDNMSTNTNKAVGESASSDNGRSGTNRRCREVLSVFYSLIGHNECDNGGLVEDVPLSVRAHLLLRALLRLPHDIYLIPWEAANTAIRSLQYSKIKHDTNNQSKHSSLSHGEELAMIAEIRSFVMCLRTEKITEEAILSQTINQLLGLGNTILEPLRMNTKVEEETLKGEQNKDSNKVGSLKRRQNSYLLPLELVPAILATMDALDDMKVDLLVTNGRGVKVDDVVMDDVTMLGESEKVKDEDEEIMHVRASEGLLLSMFASFIDDESTCCNINNFQRTMRADASLPILSLAMDDIGFSRMSTTLFIHAGVTYWNCLEFALNDVIRANNESAKKQITDEALSDEGIHIIPLADYPGLMRCVFRRVATSSSSNNTSWEYILLRLYHATAVATSKTSLSSSHRRNMPGGVDQLAMLSTVETHVLLPSCTGASVSTIKSILEACIHGCCLSCKQDSARGEFYSFSSCDNDVVPTWAAARVVLLIMRARTSNRMDSASSMRFGPRVVFRMASDMMRRQVKGNKAEGTSQSFGTHDEVAFAVKVLLHLAGVKGGTCQACCDYRMDEDTETCAYDVLKYSYYAGREQFFHRYSASENEKSSYRHQLGLETLSSYSNFVRAGLNNGARHNAGNVQSIDSFIADTARTWIDAANMLLDESNLSTNGMSSSRVFDGAAMAIVIIIVVFFEVPSSQDDIVRSIYDRLANMASHSTQKTGKQSEESCFVLISTLAWSLVASNEKRSNIDVVQRDGGQNDDLTSSVLGPLCSLLSKSALSNDQHLSSMPTNLSNETPRLSYWALRRLAHALAPMGTGREVILAMAQKHLRVLSTSSPYSHSTSRSVTFFESLPSTPSDTNDAIYLAIDCLVLLIGKYHPSNNAVVDDCGRTALGMLTDIIILKRPSSSSGSHAASRLSVNVVSWVLIELNKSARLERLAKWASQRLLRACFVGLLKFITLEQTESGGYSPILLPGAVFSMTHSSSATDEFASPDQSVMIRARNDVPGMLRLAVSLYDAIAKSGKDSDMAQLFPEPHTLLKPYLVRTFISRSDAQFESNERVLKKGHDALRRGFSPSDESIGVAIDGIFLITLVEGASKMIRKKQLISLSPKRVDADTSKNLNSYRDYIYHAEKYFYLQEGNKGITNKHGSPLPNWIEGQRPSIDASQRYHESKSCLDDTLLKCAEFKLFHMSLCDIIGDIFLWDWSHHGRVDVDNRSQDMSVLLSVISLLGSKRRVSDIVTHSSANRLLLGNMSRNSICSLLELSSQHLRPLLTTSENKKNALPEVDMLVNTVLDLCKVIQSTRFSHVFSSQSRTVSSVWALYNSLADEESSQLLSLFIKEAYVEIGGWTEADQQTADDTFSLLLITSSEDLDYQVRYLRGALLSALSQVLTIIPASLNSSSLEERKALIEKLVLILPQICQDLDAGFHGYSGGLTKRLMLLFLDVIDKCIDAMAATFESMPTTVQYQIRSSFVSVHQSARIVWDIFQDNPLRQASVVKGALRLCLGKMPNLVRRVERALDECVVNKPLREYTSELLDQCAVHLMSKPMEQSKAGETGAVLEYHGSNANKAGASTSTEFGSLASVIKAPGDEDEVLVTSAEKSEGEIRKEKNEVGLGRARSPDTSTIETLPWAYNCAFAAVANAWNDSYRIISGHDKIKRRNIEGLEDPTLSLHRIECFSRMHTSLCQMFEVKVKTEEKAEDTKTNSEESATMLAELLSYHGKSNMCSCIEKISMALSLSVKQVMKCFKESPSPGINQTDFDESFESMFCLLGYLHSVKTKPAKYDLIMGPVQWYINEKRNFRKSSNEGYPILGRLPKVVFRLEGLETEFRKLDLIVADSSCGDNDVTRKKIMILNQLTSAMTKEYKEQKQVNFGKLLREYLESLDSCKNAIKISEIHGNPMSDEDNSDADIEEDDSTWNRKRQKQRYTPMRKSRRVPLRSRNETIDNWLTVDDDEFGSAPGEKYNMDDAFVDLEDFIVEG